MTSFWKSCNAYISKSLHIHFNTSQNASLISLLDSLVIVTNKGRLLPNVSNKETDGGIRYNLFAYFVHIWNISNIACHKELSNLNLLFISKFRFDWVHRKMVNDIHLMIVRWRHRKAIVMRCFNDNYCR